MSVAKTIETKTVISASSELTSKLTYVDFEWTRGDYAYVKAHGNVIPLEAEDLKELGLALINLGKAMEARNAQQTS